MEGNLAERDGVAVSRERLAQYAGLLAALAICQVSILDPDLPWHLSAARGILASGGVPHRDVLSWTMAGQPWVDFEWGSELIFYGLERLGGTAALWLFRAAALFAATLLFVGLLRLWKIPRTWTGLAAPAFAASLFPLFGVRPEIFSMLFFLVELQLLERRRLGAFRRADGRFVLLHAVLYAAWANLHAGFAAGLALCACYAVGELLERRERRVPVPAMACAAGLLGTFANPYGARIYDVLFDHWRHIGVLSRLIEEWKAPDLLKTYLSGYWLLVVFSFTGLLLAARQGLALPAEHVAAVAAFAFFGSRSVRTTAYVMLVVFPLGLNAWGRLALTARARRALALAAALAVPFIAWRGFTWAGSLRFLGWPPPMEAQGPVRTFAFLRKEKAALSGLRLFNPYNWGGSLGYALGPDYKVFIDGRYIFADLLAVVDRAERDPAAFRQFVDDHDIGVAVEENDGVTLRYPWDSRGRPYIAYALPRVDWALVYWDSDAIVLVRRSFVSPRWLASREFRWIRPDDLHQLGLYIVSGVAPAGAVEAEIERYRREIGDPRETAVLTSWFSEFKRGLPARAGRR
jgi:hypothetical protein